MKKLAETLENINEQIGRIFSWSTTFLVWVLFALVIMRYAFGSFSQKMSELSIYFFALSFLFASGYTFKHDKHVRVDLFYNNWTDKRKAWVNLIGGLLFLTPWCLVSIIVCYNYAMTSFMRGESSSQPSGLPAIYVLKFILFGGFVLLFIQGLASILKAILVLQGNENYKIENEQFD